MDIFSATIASALKIRKDQAESAIQLLDAGNTIPFIARYRKEATGILDEEQLRQVSEQLARLRTLEDRRATIITSISEQEKLTPELKLQILNCTTLTALEDIYLPYKPKRRTRASIARENGLQPLADLLLKQPRTGQKPEQAASDYLSEKVPSIEDALAGARDIVAETISENASVRASLREKALQRSQFQVAKDPASEDPRQVYQTYYQFDLPVNRLRPHQVLAINRGETEKVLRGHILIPERDWRQAIQSQYQPDPRSSWGAQLEEALSDSAERLLLPAIEREVRSNLSEKSEKHAITVFASNLRALLSQPPLTGQTVLGLDPGFRTGSKLAVVDPTGKILETGTIYPHEPQKKWALSLEILSQLVEKHHVTLISIGNGTASRETEQLAAELIRNLPDLRYAIVNEAGASVYSASPLARAEMPDLDVSIRGAVSIARRIQDPLAELVKIDPKSIGVGMYQHDVDQSELDQALKDVVESVVNHVGVDLNTASPSLLTYVSGIGPKLAEKIIAYREEHGPFHSRLELKKVAGLGPKAFEQSAGFLRIRNGENLMDASAIHPESYLAARAVLELAKISITTPPSEKQNALDKLVASQPVETLAKKLAVGVPTIKDILEQLVKPGRDPRADLPTPILRSDVLSMNDLTPGMRLKGTVRNVVDFGAFIDLGVKHDALLHRSAVPAGTVLQVGEVILVEILKVEIERERISISLVEQ